MTSRVRGDSYARFCEGPVVKFLRPTRQSRCFTRPMTIWFVRNPSGRATIAGSLAFFAVLYAPFFASRGFADRFDYLPTLGVALLLAWASVA